MKSLIIAAGIFAATPTLALAQDSDNGAPAQPAPTNVPPPPSAKLPPPPSAPDEAQQEVQEQAPAPQAAPGPAPSGQWTYTQQYGWIWTPYARSYTYVDDSGETAFTYAYYNGGWRWLPSPWVLGWGPRPYWGRYGYARFAWNVHPWFHVGVYRPEVWNRWGGAYGHGFVYARSYDRVGVRARYGRAYVGHPHGGGGWHRR